MFLALVEKIMSFPLLLVWSSISPYKQSFSRPISDRYDVVLLGEQVRLLERKMFSG